MLSYLKGTLSAIQKQGGNRVWVTVEVNHLGYDLQITPRLLSELPPLGESVHLFCHLQVKDDQPVLFGFGSRPERDLFRQLVSVSGIGPQMAMALLDTLGMQGLLQAVVTANARVLSRTPGVGNKTAERLILELKGKLSEWRQQAGLVMAPMGGPGSSIQEEVEMTLLALGYTNSEITKALEAVGQGTTLSKVGDTEGWIREAITWLSQ